MYLFDYFMAGFGFVAAALIPSFVCFLFATALLAFGVYWHNQYIELEG